MRLLVLVLLASCVAASEPIEPQVTSGVMRKQIPMAVNRQLDLLFVIDSSPAMAPYADTVRTNLGRFVDVLRNQPAGFPDLRLGVVTTDLADDGRLRGTTGLTGNFIVDTIAADGTRLHNYAGELSDVLARMTDVGTAGGPAQPLVAARRALENPMNRSFLRDNAYTAIYWITATDAADTDLVGYEQFFKQLHVDPSKVIVAGVLGDGSRMPAFLDRFPNRSARASIAALDWTSVFEIITQTYKTTLGSPCIEGPLLDVDPVMPGPQYECAAWIDYEIGGAVLRPCDGTLTGSCWKIVEDKQTCIGESALLKIEQLPQDLPGQAMLNLECLSR